MFRLSVCLTTPETQPVPVSLFSGTFKERIAKAKKSGFSGIEVMTAHPENLEQNNLDLITGKGMEISAFGTGAMFFHEKLSLMNQDKRKKAEKALRFLYNLVDIASRVKGLITIGSFRGRAGDSGKDKAIRRFKTILKEILQYAEKAEVRIALEPLNRYEADFINTAEEGIDFVKSVGMGNFGLVLDTYHMNIEESDMGKAIHKAGKHLFHVHIGDSNRWAAGRGHIHFKEILAALNGINYKGFLSAELLGKPGQDSAGKLTAEYFIQEKWR